MTKIDAFAHILPPAYAERLEALTSGGAVSQRILGYRPWIREDPALIDLDARWRTIDPFGDYRQVLTLAVPPLDELGDPAAAAELDRTMSHLGAVGAQLHANVGGAPLDEPRFEVIFEVVTSHGGAFWLHPTRSPIWSDYPAEPASKYGIWWSLGWPYETSVAMARLVYSGCFDRYPGLTVITHHAGAMVPHFAGRLASPIEDPDRDAIVGGLKDEPIEYFRRFYADTAMFGASHAVRCAVEFFGADHVLFGTDMPLGGPNVVADTIADVTSLDLPEADEAAIFAGNARRLLGIAG